MATSPVGPHCIIAGRPVPVLTRGKLFDWQPNFSIVSFVSQIPKFTTIFHSSRVELFVKLMEASQVRDK